MVAIADSIEAIAVELVVGPVVEPAVELVVDSDLLVAVELVVELVLVVEQLAEPVQSSY